MTDEFVAVAKEKTTPDRKIAVSNIVDFFEDFEKNFGKSLPSQSAGFGNEWDWYTASLTEVSARVRRSVEKLRAGEAAQSVVDSAAAVSRLHRLPLHLVELADPAKAAGFIWLFLGA